MPPKGHKRKAKRGGDVSEPTRELILPSEDQIFGMVLKALGDRHFTVSCQDGLERRCKVRGKMHKRQYVQVGMTVIVSTRDYSEGTADIVHLYTNAEVRELRKAGMLLLAEVRNDEDTDEKKIDEAFEWDTL
jgi:translation initiation factor 1A